MPGLSWRYFFPSVNYFYIGGVNGGRHPVPTQTEPLNQIPPGCRQLCGVLMILIGTSITPAKSTKFIRKRCPLYAAFSGWAEEISHPQIQNRSQTKWVTEACSVKYIKKKKMHHSPQKEKLKTTGDRIGPLAGRKLPNRYPQLHFTTPRKALHRCVKGKIQAELLVVANSHGVNLLRKDFKAFAHPSFTAEEPGRCEGRRPYLFLKERSVPLEPLGSCCLFSVSSLGTLFTENSHLGWSDFAGLTGPTWDSGTEKEQNYKLHCPYAIISFPNLQFLQCSLPPNFPKCFRRYPLSLWCHSSLRKFPTITILHNDIFTLILCMAIQSWSKLRGGFSARWLLFSQRQHPI